MKLVEIVGYKREITTKSAVKQLRAEGNVPCVLYGEGEPVHFYAPMILFRDAVYTADAHFIALNIEGTETRAILQDIQFHPVNEMIMHADFMELTVGKMVKMDIPVHLDGQPKGVVRGGQLMHKRRSLTVKALPKDMPEYIELDVTELDFHHSIKVREINLPNCEILDAPQASVAVVEIPRALRGADADEEDEEGEEGEEGAEGAEAPAEA